MRDSARDALRASEASDGERLTTSASFKISMISKAMALERDSAKMSR